MEEFVPLGRYIKYGVGALDEKEKEALGIGSTEGLNNTQKNVEDIVFGSKYYDHMGWDQFLGAPKLGRMEKYRFNDSVEDSMITVSRTGVSQDDTVPVTTMASVEHLLKKYGSVRRMCETVTTATGEERNYATTNTTTQYGNTHDAED